MESFITLTDHAKERALERHGVGENTLLIMAENAVMKGFSSGDAPEEWISDYFRRKVADGLIYYHEGRVFIFSEDFVLLTTHLMNRNLYMAIERAIKRSGK